MKSADDGVKYKPEFEIKYRKSNGEKSVRKITVLKLGEFLNAYCFLKHSECTFAFSKIKECIDLSTGELVTGDFMTYYAKSRVDSIKPCFVFDFYYWEEIDYSCCSEIPSAVSGFDVNEKHVMGIVTFKDGLVKKEFLCGRVVANDGGIDRFCIELVDDRSEKIFVGMSKIYSVEGINDFGAYIANKFYESKTDRV